MHHAVRERRAAMWYGPNEMKVDCACTCIRDVYLNHTAMEFKARK